MTKTKCNIKRVVAWYHAHKGNASATARKFGVSRQTIHSYLNKMKPKSAWTQDLNPALRRKPRKNKKG